ncbi:Mitochondrial presequence protease [Scheffersomyces spartinae]|uniref:Presequence protease, mitochondrial n=1 Tax=Scheffersomyces spartinae TaxID=45513 RepID=A0A9P7VAU2_9ASCO|nr:Mitochondrial presequence protease [Scheffersomyces spartinae]KAG7194573.1 Mitochondrial presequence protease [Scheffersomyces spartinae]
MLRAKGIIGTNGLRAARLRQICSRKLATFADTQSILLSKYPIGLKVHGYTIEQTQPVPEFSLVAVRLRHGRSGSEHLHLDSPNDKNNVFAIAFKTNPPDATGVPHILEHTSLCGSYKYPVRDPFFKMLNRSLSNFMNAMTAHDYTYYPFATTNGKDFDNLMDVYLSSTLQPLLSHQDFMQEGWRLENEDLADPNSPLTFKGVVYNEMKGQYANSAYYYWIKFQEAIYKSLHNSGGDPKNITDLAYEDFIQFHETNYHPSNSRTFTYGSLPLTNHLEKLDTAFAGFGSRSNSSQIKYPIFESYEPTTTTKSVSVKGPFDSSTGVPIENQLKGSITWNLGNPLDESKQYEVFKWKLLSSLLCDGHSSPLYQQLIETGLGDDFSINTGLDSTTALLSFSVGLSNSTQSTIDGLEDKVIAIIKETVLPELEVAHDGNYHMRVLALLHQLELGFKKHKPDFGLGLLNSILPSWINGVNPISSIQVQQILDRFKLEYQIKGLGIFKQMIEQTLLNPQTQRLKFTLVPDASFANELITEEATRLESQVKNLDDSDKKIIYDRALQLKEKQEQEEDISVLPTLTLKDIPRTGDFYPLEFSNIKNNEESLLQKRIVDTNGLIYAAGLKDLSFLPSKYYPYLPIFASCLTNLAGTASTPITDLEIKISKSTGGISFNVSSRTDPYNLANAKLQFTMNGMALEDDAQQIYDLWYEILHETKFNSEDETVVDKLSTLIKGLAQKQVDMVTDRGHSYAGSVSNSKLTPAKYIGDMLNGMQQVEFILKINSELERNGKAYLKETVLPILKEIQEFILIHGHFKYSLVGNAQALNTNEQLLGTFNEKLLSNSTKSTQKNELQVLLNNYRQIDQTDQHELIDLPTQVGYASLAKLGTTYDTKDGASLQVLSHLLTFKHLHSVIREANGAYGGGLNYDGLGGVLNFYSYRDPNAVKSVESFENTLLICGDKIKEWDANDLQEAKLSIFQSVDAPMNIASQGATYFYEGIDDELRQQRRENFLDVSISDLTHVAEKYLINKENKKAITVIGNNDLLNVGNDWAIRKVS